MHTRYFRKKDPNCRKEDIEWIKVTGQAFYHPVNAPKNQDHHFNDGIKNFFIFFVDTLPKRASATVVVAKGKSITRLCESEGR